MVGNGTVDKEGTLNSLMVQGHSAWKLRIRNLLSELNLSRYLM